MRTPVARTPQVQDLPSGASKQKKQLIVLAGLALALVAVLALQFGQEATAAVPAKAATGQLVAGAGSSASSDSSKATRPAVLARNAALSRGADDGGLPNPRAFESFWSLSDPLQATVEELPPPRILLSATLVGRSGALDVAVIDGSLHYVGDVIGGWILDAISSREVALRSTTDRVVAVAMPLLRPPPPRSRHAADAAAPVTAAAAQPLHDS